jgi:Holliday junction resolvasome RuvABC DNA-binding subunit
MEAPVPERGGVAAGGSPLEADVISALLNLGYDRRVAEKAVEDVQSGAKDAGGGSFESLLRASLQQLSSPTKQSARGAA